MGIIVNGVNGGFSGKAGSIIGSSWKSINYIKGLYKKRTKPATQEQLITQARFRVLMRFLLPITSYLQVGFGLKRADRQTPINAAFQFNLPLVVQGTYPDFTLNYAQMRIADGSFYLGAPQTPVFEDGQLSVSWDPANNELYHTADDDGVYILCYHPGLDEFLAPATVPMRAAGGAAFTVPSHMLGGDLHVWIFMADRRKKRVSRSSYLGLVTLN